MQKRIIFDESYDPYKAAYGSMPSSASANPEIKQLYINGHFCYVTKFGLVTNGLGIVRHIAAYNTDFFDNHPEIIIEKKSDSPDEDKSVHDARLLIPTLMDFFQKHPLIQPKTFIGDAAFDSANIYESLLASEDYAGKCFEKAYIPLNQRRRLKNPDYTINENGIPCCPNDPALPMKPEGNAIVTKSSTRYKFVCPKMKWMKVHPDEKAKRKTLCESPCTTSSAGRMAYLHQDSNLRTFPGTIRGTDDWNENYKTRHVVEHTIQHLKDSFCVAGRKTHNTKTLHAELLLAGITQLITVIVADSIHQHQLIRSLKPLVA